MSYQIIPNIIFIFAVLGILLIILRHLPEAKNLAAQEPIPGTAESKLVSKESAKKAASVFRAWLRQAVHRMWNFALEAKDLKPGVLTPYGIKHIFKDKPKAGDSTQQLVVPAIPQVQAAGAAPAPKLKDEKQLLETIKQDPKNFTSYDELGKYYIDSQKFEDARDIYVYLINHQPTNPTYHARLAYSFYRLRQFKKAADHYRRSLALDSSQPNRYYNLSLTLDAYGDKTGAIESLEKALTLDSKNIKFYTTLASLLTKYGQKDKAREALTKARTLDPANADIIEKLNTLK